MERLTRWLLLWPALLALLAGWLYAPLTPRYRALEAATRRGDAAAVAARHDWLRTGAYLPASRAVRAGLPAGENPPATTGTTAGAADREPPPGSPPPARPAPR